MIFIFISTDTIETLNLTDKALGGNRTLDLLLTRQMHYRYATRASYAFYDLGLVIAKLLLARGTYRMLLPFLVLDIGATELLEIHLLDLPLTDGTLHEHAEREL